MAWSVNPGNGKVTPVAGAPFLENPGGAGPRELQVTPNGKFVYVVNINTDTVAGYAINPSSGALTQVPGSPFSVGTTANNLGCVSCPLGITIHSSGRFVYVANSTNSNQCFCQFGAENPVEQLAIIFAIKEDIPKFVFLTFTLCKIKVIFICNFFSDAMSNF